MDVFCTKKGALTQIKQRAANRCNVQQIVGLCVVVCYLWDMEKREELFSVQEMVTYGCKIDSPFGDLCKDIKEDVNFPWGDSLSGQISYLVAKAHGNPTNLGLENAVEDAIDYLTKRLERV